MKPTYLDLTNPVTIAVLPLKDAAIERAENDAKALLVKLLAALETAGWDVNTAAPRPNGNMGREQYKRMINWHNLLLSISTYVDQPYRRMNDPHLRARSPEAEARFIQNARDMAATQYDMFVAKLCRKVGPCLTAILTGTHVWGYSVLTVGKEDGTIERWQTQQIVNQSVLGTLFNQWPTRKLKGA